MLNLCDLLSKEGAVPRPPAHLQNISIQFVQNFNHHSEDAHFWFCVCNDFDQRAYQKPLICFSPVSCCKSLHWSRSKLRVLRGTVFWHLNPVMPCNLLHQPGQLEKVNLMAQSQTDQIIFYPDQNQIGIFHHYPQITRF